jgi:serine/threonine protein kinase
LTELEEDFLEWERAISGYVVQHTKIEDAYTIIDKLGQGSFGYVVLAEPKNLKPQKLQSDSNRGIGRPSNNKVSIVIIEEPPAPNE